MHRLIAIVAAIMVLASTAASAFADSPFAGSSGNFSTATCPNGNNPHCPPQGH